MTQPALRPSPDTRRRLRNIQRRIAALLYICSGTISHQTRRCGKLNCACLDDPLARHGPYYVWSRREGKRQVNSMLPPEVGPLFERAVANYRELRDLLREWETASAKSLLAAREPNSYRRQHLGRQRKRVPSP